jgi:hypothetical protein
MTWTDPAELDIDSPVCRTTSPDSICAPFDWTVTDPELLDPEPPDEI